MKREKQTTADDVVSPSASFTPHSFSSLCALVVKTAIQNGDESLFSWLSSFPSAQNIGSFFITAKGAKDAKNRNEMMIFILLVFFASFVPFAVHFIGSFYPCSSVKSVVGFIGSFFYFTAKARTFFKRILGGALRALRLCG